MPRLTQKVLNHVLRLRVVALAKMMVANVTVCVDEVMRWPILVVEPPPDCVVVVDRNRVIDSKTFHSSTDVVDVPLERKLRRVNPDDRSGLGHDTSWPMPRHRAACAGS